LSLVALLALAACSGTPPSGALAKIPAPPDVAAAPADALRTSTNLASKVIVPGKGSRHPRPNSTVTVHYTGWTTDGRMFDSSVARGEPSTFSLNNVIPGWTEGVQMMVEGEKRRFWIPGRLAYEGAPGKPQGTLVFDIELIRIDS
jgi:FKBP-type peptidyl-prolyl cis-trans isomerase